MLTLTLQVVGAPTFTNKQKPFLLARTSCAVSSHFFHPALKRSLLLRGWPVLASWLSRIGQATHRGRIGRLKGMGIIPARLRTGSHFPPLSRHRSNGRGRGGRACVVSLSACGRSLRGGADRARATRATHAGPLGGFECPTGSVGGLVRAGGSRRAAVGPEVKRRTASSVVESAEGTGRQASASSTDPPGPASSSRSKQRQDVGGRARQEQR